MKFEELLKTAVDNKASDIFIIVGLSISIKVMGTITPVNDERVMPNDSETLMKEAYALANRTQEKLNNFGDDDFSVSIKGLSRFRVSAYRQRGTLAAVIRVVPFDIPAYSDMNIPKEVISIADKTKGLVLVTGPAGGGKSTTLACIIDTINSNKNGHIITLEEPIEYLHRNKKSIISQREIHADTEGYVPALRACLRQAPDVILVGEMRDFETIQTAMTAAETGHLIISTLHSVGAANTIDRIIDVFPPNQQNQVRMQLSQLLQSVISQQLVPTISGSLLPVFEIMHCNSAIRNMIRESKVHQLDTVINASAAEGMMSMDNSLLKMVKSGVISRETALEHTENPELLERKMDK